MVFLEQLDVKVSKTASIDFFMKQVKRKIGFVTDGNLSLYYCDDLVDTNDTNISSKAVESILNEEDGYEVTCQLIEAGLFRGNEVTLINSTDEVLEAVFQYQVRTYSMEKSHE